MLALTAKAAERRREQCFVVEGARELSRCVASGWSVESLFCREGAVLDAEAAAAVETALQGGAVRCGVTADVYARMAYRDSTEGVIAVVRERAGGLDDLRLRRDALVVVLEGVEKPGNVGAVLRSADAAGVDAVLVCDERCDLRNPNLLRASLGAAFSVPAVACASSRAIGFLKGQGLRILTAQLQDSRLYYDTDMTVGTALVMGTEATGLTPQWREAADAHIRIPMLGRVDSLNVSVSAAVLIYEAVRQRRAQSSDTLQGQGQ